jgi:hypothetical protein
MPSLGPGVIGGGNPTTIKAKTNSYYYELLNMSIFNGKMENMSTPSTTSHITTIFNKIEIYLSSKYIFAIFAAGTRLWLCMT